jgi:hypothetical protein
MHLRQHPIVESVPEAMAECLLLLLLAKVVLIILAVDNLPDEKKLTPSPNSGAVTSYIHNRVARLYCGAYIDNYGHQKIMLLYNHDNNETKLLRKLKLVILLKPPKQI